MTRILVALIAFLALVGCGGGSGDSAVSSGSAGTGKLVLRVTDKPFDHSMVERAVVRVRRVDVHSERGFQTVYSGPGMAFDLLTLQAGVTSTLIDVDLPVGDYDQIRLYINSAELGLTNGKVYSTSNGNLQLTSLDTSGLKLKVSPPVTVVSGLDSTLLLDFDMSKTFHAVPANDPLNAKKFQLHPHIKVTNVSDSGTVRGVVSEDDGFGQTVPVVGATVYLMPPGVTDPTQSLASTGSVAGGAYALLGVTPGTYDLLATFGSKHSSFGPLVVAAGNVATVNLFVQ